MEVRLRNKAVSCNTHIKQQGKLKKKKRLEGWDSSPCTVLSAFSLLSHTFFRCSWLWFQLVWSFCFVVSPQWVITRRRCQLQLLCVRTKDSFKKKKKTGKKYPRGSKEKKKKKRLDNVAVVEGWYSAQRSTKLKFTAQVSNRNAV